MGKIKEIGNIMRIILQRDSPLEKVVFGKLNLTWMTSQPDIYTIVPYPAIPSGIYQLIGHNTTLHPNVWEVANVPGHTGILIHVGNYASEVRIGEIIHASNSQNCILPGFGINENIPMVTRSAECIEYLRTQLGIKSQGTPLNIELEIRDAL